MASLDNLIFFLLLFVTILYWSSLIFTNFKILNKLSFFGNVLVNGLIFTLLGLRWLNYGYFPLSNLYESLIFLCCGISLIHLYVEQKTNLRIYPTTLNNLTLKYLYVPIDVVWGYTLDGQGRPVYNPATSVQPEWLENDYDEIIARAAKIIGVSLKDQLDIQYGNSVIQTGE